MAARKGTIKAKVEMDPTYKVPRRLYEIDEPASNGDPREVEEECRSDGVDHGLAEHLDERT